MALAFLTKKMWHPSTMENQERVWKARQKDKEEKRKIEELRRQRAEERQMEELQALQDGGRPRQDRLDWMYTGEAAMMPTSDEYLMGKEWKGEGEADDVERMAKDASVPGAAFLSAPNAAAPPAGAAAPAAPGPASAPAMTEAAAKAAAFAIQQDDPLFAMKAQEAHAREAVLGDPLLMARIKQRLLAESDE
ncbi:cwf25, partial [Symbiodinium sp. KB8]